VQRRAQRIPEWRLVTHTTHQIRELATSRANDWSNYGAAESFELDPRALQWNSWAAWPGHSVRSGNVGTVSAQSNPSAVTSAGAHWAESTFATSSANGFRWGETARVSLIAEYPVGCALRCSDLRDHARGCFSDLTRTRADARCSGCHPLARDSDGLDSRWLVPLSAHPFEGSYSQEKRRRRTLSSLPTRTFRDHLDVEGVPFATRT